MEENVRELTNRILASEFRLIYFKIAFHKHIHMKSSLLNFVVNGYFFFYKNVLSLVCQSYKEKESELCFKYQFVINVESLKFLCPYLKDGVFSYFLYLEVHQSKYSTVK